MPPAEDVFASGSMLAKGNRLELVLGKTALLLPLLFALRVVESKLLLRDVFECFFLGTAGAEGEGKSKTPPPPPLGESATVREAEEVLRLSETRDSESESSEKEEGSSSIEMLGLA